MKDIITKTAVVGAVVALSLGTVATVQAAEATLSTDFVSAYVFRGATANDGFVIQPGLEVAGELIPAEYGSISVGAWGNYDVDDNDGALTGSQFSEIDFYGSYGLPTLVEGVDLALGYTHYAYINQQGASTTADKEASIGASTEVAGVGVGATVYYMMAGDNATQVYYELSGSYAVEVSEDLEVSADVTAAAVTQGNAGEAAGFDDGLHNATVTLSASYAVCESASVGVFGTYIAQLDDEVLVDVDDDGLYDVDFLGGVNVTAAF